MKRLALACRSIFAGCHTSGAALFYLSERSSPRPTERNLPSDGVVAPWLVQMAATNFRRLDGKVVLRLLESPQTAQQDLTIGLEFRLQMAFTASRLSAEKRPRG